MRRFLTTYPIFICGFIVACSVSKKSPPAATEAASSLTYVESVSGDASAANSSAPVIAVHGMGDDPENFKELFTHLPKPTRVILPQAPKSFASGYSWFDIRFPISRSAEELRPGISAAADLVAKLIVTLGNESKNKAKPVITGFSQGGAISYAVASKYPSLIAAAVPLSGAIPKSLYPEKTSTSLPPICAAHGDQDDLIPIEGARQSVRAFVAAGGKADLFEIQGLGHRVDDRMRRFLFDKLYACFRDGSSVQ